ncbi:YDG domain-containing protein, partial [Algoriphagus aquimarinus]|uniref:beta strand repeat-containing protein n=1 Tax=Algoriphagus aquimarinus TaxID=237018 RepID=UPI0030DACC15
MKNLYKASVFGLLSLVFLFFLGNTFTVNAQGGTATVTTDKDDYAPGEYVIITGSGWEPGERVAFTFEETPKPETCVNSHDNFAIADPSGNIFYDGFLIKINHLGVAFVLTATGQNSGSVAVTEFTDGNVNFGISGNVPNNTDGFTVTVTYTPAIPQNATQVTETIGPFKSQNTAAVAAKDNTTITWVFNQNTNYVWDGTSSYAQGFTVSGNYNGNNAVKGNYITCTAPSISTAPTAQTITYGDIEPIFSVTASGDGLSYQWQYNTTAVPGTWVNVGTNSSSYSVSSPKANFNGRTYRVVITGACGSIASTPVALTVNKKALTAASTVASKEYNGSPATGAVSLGTVSGLVGTETLVITSSATNYINADAGVGKATTISYNLADGTNGGLAANYSMADFATTGVITKANQTITVITPSPATAIYNTNFSVVATATSGLAVAYTSTAPLSNSGTDYTMTSGTGTGVVRYNQAGNNNYNAAPEVTATVNAAKADAVITVSPYSVTYDGNAFTSTFTAVGVETSPVDLTGLIDVSATTHTNAGAFIGDAWSFTGNTNYAPANGTVDNAIGQADAVITVTPYSVTYDGNAHTSTFTAVGVETSPVDLTGLMDVSATTHTNAGAYIGDAWSFAGNTNYAPVNGTVDNNIDKADAVIVVNPYDVTYDANPHTSIGSATGVSSEALAGLDLSATTHTNAGDYTGDVWTFTDVTGNYNDDNGTVDNNIDKADAVIVVNAYDVTYDANPHTSIGSATGVSSEALAGLDLSATTHTNAGDYTGDVWTFTDVTGNYNDDNGTVDNNIDKADAVIVVNAYDVTYDA